MNNLQDGLISNGVTVAVVALLWIIIQRLRNCSSGCHTSFCHIESDTIKEDNQVKLFKRALTEFQRDSQREVNNIAIAASGKPDSIH